MDSNAGSANCFQEPTDAQKAALTSIVDHIIEIFWDGDDVYYPCTVLSVNGDNNVSVRYFGDSEDPADENLLESKWRIWNGRKDVFVKKYETEKKKEEAKAKNAARAKMSYSDMVVEAVYNLNEKGGSSLQAVRKYLRESFNVNKTQVASFNNLSLKAITKAVADQQLEMNGRLYKVSVLEKERRKRLVVQASQAAVAAQRAAKLAFNNRHKRGKRGKDHYGSRYDEDKYDPDEDENPMVSGLYMGTVFENNRYLRKQLLEFRKRRDDYLFAQHYEILESFLQENNYFEKLLRKEAEMSLNGTDGSTAKGPGLDKQAIAAVSKSFGLVIDNGSSDNMRNNEKRVEVLQAADVLAPVIKVTFHDLGDTEAANISAPVDIESVRSRSGKKFKDEATTTMNVNNLTLSGKFCPSVLSNIALPNPLYGFDNLSEGAGATLASYNPTIGDIISLKALDLGMEDSLVDFSACGDSVSSTVVATNENCSSVSHCSPKELQSMTELVDGRRVVWTGKFLSAEATVLYRYLLYRLGLLDTPPELPVTEHVEISSISSSAVLVQDAAMPCNSAPTESAKVAVAANPESMAVGQDVDSATILTSTPAEGKSVPSSHTGIVVANTAAHVEGIGGVASAIGHSAAPGVTAMLSRLNPTQIVGELNKLRQLSYQNVYFLEKTVEPDSKTMSVQGSDMEEHEPQLPTVMYTTVLRDVNGVFLPHVSQVMKMTQGYATKDTIPISNSTLIKYWVEGGDADSRTVKRPFCDAKRYNDIFRGVVVGALKIRPKLARKVISLLQGEELPEAPPVPAPLPVSPAESKPDQHSQDETALVNSEDVSSEEAEAQRIAAAKVIQTRRQNSAGMKVVNPREAPLLGEKISKHLSPSTKLHDYQVVGVSWMVHMYQTGMPMILGDQMGLGKTLQTISFISTLIHEYKQTGPYLIVVPLSVLSNWMSEVEKFCPSLRAVRFHGPKAERLRIKEEELFDLRNFDIIITTYEMFVSETTYFRRRFMYTAVIVDEGHRLKNNKNLLSEKLRGIPTLSKVILTGTPLQNNMFELWALLHYLAPEVFPTSTSALFESGFDLNKGYVDNDVLRRARKLLEVFMLRRVKSDISVKLPPRKELSMVVPLTDCQITWYKQLLASMDADIIDVIVRDPGESNDTPIAGGGDKQWRKLMNLVLQLRKVCNHVCLMPGGENTIGLRPVKLETDMDVDEIQEDISKMSATKRHLMQIVQYNKDREHRKLRRAEDLQMLIRGSGKLAMLDRMLPKLKENGHRVLLFSQFTSMLDILQEYCDLREYQYVRLDGETSRVQRRLDCRRFNASKSSLFIFLISTRAGGLGLNLATADTVILYDSDWNPQVDLQAMERAHRIGQTKPVRIYRMVCKGSIEEKMLDKASKKLYLNAMVGEKHVDEDEEDGDKPDEGDDLTGGSMSTGVTKSELIQLIRYGANAILESIAVANAITEGGASASTSSSKDQIGDQELDALLCVDNDWDEEAKQKPSGKGEQGDSVTNAAETETVIPTSSSSDNLQAFNEFLQCSFSSNGMSTSAAGLGAGGMTKSVSSVKKSNSSDLLGGLDYSNIIQDGSSRDRKSRIVMVDGKGTGYGGAVPILAENKESEQEASTVATDTKRERIWNHLPFCVLCARVKYQDPNSPTMEEVGVCTPVSTKSRRSASTTKKSGQKPKSTKKKTKQELLYEAEQERIRVAEEIKAEEIRSAEAKKIEDANFLMLKCAHCPNAVHAKCAAGTVLEPTGGGGLGSGFTCPFHKCVTCNRNTSAAGGLLFRCVSCFTAYCEDCLPDDEIESVGSKNVILEDACDYYCKQAYYIKCGHCCETEGVQVTGIYGELGNESDEASTEEDGSDVSDSGELEGDIVVKEKKKKSEAEAPSVLPTQLLKLCLIPELEEEELEPEPELPKGKSNKRKVEEANSIKSEPDFEESATPKKIKKLQRSSNPNAPDVKPSRPPIESMSEVITLMNEFIDRIGDRDVTSRSNPIMSIDVIDMKLRSGRAYRSTAAFVSDIKEACAVINSLNKGSKEDALKYFNNEIFPYLALK